MLWQIERQQQIQNKSDTDQGKAINLYKTILDTMSRNKLGVTPLKPRKKIDAVKKDLQALLIEMEPLGGLVSLDKHWSRC
jgi:endothelin-converting enzyme/putative endopeptidase